MPVLIDALRGRLIDATAHLGFARAEPKTSIEEIGERMRFAGFTMVADLSGAGQTTPRMCCIHYAEDSIDTFADEGWRVTNFVTVENGTLCAIMEVSQ